MNCYAVFSKIRNFELNLIRFYIGGHVCRTISNFVKIGAINMVLYIKFAGHIVG
jgi:hypothetical protein